MTPAEKRLFDLAPRPSAAISLENLTILHVNSLMAVVLGREPAALIGQPWLDFLAAADAQKFQNAVARLGGAGSAEHLLWSPFPAGGRRRPEAKKWRAILGLVESDGRKSRYIALEAVSTRVKPDLVTPLNLILGPLEELLDRGGFDPTATSVLEVVRRNGLKLQERIDRLSHGSDRQRRSTYEDEGDRREVTLIGEGPLILVASGDTDERAYLENLLHRSGFDGRSVSDAETAFSACVSASPALLLCDAALPPNGGLALTRRLRADERAAGLPIMLISTRSGELARIEGYEAGADEYIEKPFGVRELIARIDAAVRLSAARAEISAKQRRIAVLGRLASVVETAMDAVISVNEAQKIVLFNRAAEEMFRCGAEEALGRPLGDFIPQRFRERHEIHVAAFGRTGVSGRSMGRLRDLTAARLDGSEFPIEASISQARVEGEVLFTVILRDISERKAAMETEHLLIGELDHRVKNTLAMVQAIANQTARAITDPVEFAKSFNGRIRAMAVAHTLLTRASWSGADLGDLIREQLTLGPADPRIHCRGENISLPPQFALHFGLVMHELGANARKYGALSLPDGRLDLEWRVETIEDAPWIHFDWIESGGPSVTPPAKKNFGTRLIESSLTHSLHGTVELVFEPSGLHCKIRLPLRQ